MFLHMFSFFFFNDTATTEIYTLSLHDALPISLRNRDRHERPCAVTETQARVLDGKPDVAGGVLFEGDAAGQLLDRKSTRLNSSHLVISYAVFCLKKKHHQPLHMLRTADVTLSA